MNFVPVSKTVSNTSLRNNKKKVKIFKLTIPFKS